MRKHSDRWYVYWKDNSFPSLITRVTEGLILKRSCAIVAHVLRRSWTFHGLFGMKSTFQLNCPINTESMAGTRSVFQTSYVPFNDYFLCFAFESSTNGFKDGREEERVLKKVNFYRNRDAVLVVFGSGEKGGTVDKVN